MSSSFDTSEIQKALKRLDTLRKETKQELTERAARGFVKNLITITPPASKSNTGSSAKKAGETAIDVDTALTLEPTSEDSLRATQEFHGREYAANQLKNKKGEVYLEDKNTIIWSAEAALAFHLAKRSKSTGRPPSALKGRTSQNRVRMRDAGAHNQHVGRSIADNIALVPKAIFDQVRKLLKLRVGELAAGWNRAAAKLGVKGVPSWIKRHTSPGDITIVTKDTLFRIEVWNDVKYVGTVKGYDYRIKKAVDYQANAINREADFLLKKQIKKAGWGK